MRAPRCIGVACLLLLLAAPRLRSQDGSSPAPAPTLTANFSGAWVGVLEYRDYSSDAQVFLPTWLTMTALPGGLSVSFSYLYDDGPEKVVREQASLTFDTTVNTAALKTGDHTDQFEVKGLGAFQRAGGRGTLTLTGTGNENGKPVYTRVLLTLGRNLYTWRKETCSQDGKELFRLRDAYTFTREKPPVP